MHVGNMQIGDDRLMEELFTEPRFNGWVVGEVHIIDERVVPNGRRDHFEQNVHFHNLLTHLSPIARELSRKCRLSSIARNRSREFERRIQVGKEKLAIIKQRSLGRGDQARLLREVHGLIADLEKLAMADSARLQQDNLNPIREIQKLKRDAIKVASARTDSSLNRFPKANRVAFEKVGRTPVPGGRR
jgi:hypothetical protein